MWLVRLKLKHTDYINTMTTDEQLKKTLWLFNLMTIKLEQSQTTKNFEQFWQQKVLCKKKKSYVQTTHLFRLD